MTAVAALQGNAKGEPSVVTGAANLALLYQVHVDGDSV